VRRLRHERECRIPHAGSIVEQWRPLALPEVTDLSLPFSPGSSLRLRSTAVTVRIQPVELGQVDLMVGYVPRNTTRASTAITP
jgi:hypothetical protein